MTLLPFAPFVLFASLVSCAAAAIAPTTAPVPQEQTLPTRTQGTILKGDVDTLVEAIAAQTNKPGSAAPYVPTIDGAARMLCAMGHCHRYYVAVDHPRIRATLGMLIAGRRDDGSFGATAGEDPMTTAWVVDAMTVMDAERYRDEIQTAKKWLAGQGIEGSPFAGSVAETMAQLRADVFPEHIAQATVAAAAKLRESTAFDLAEGVALLVRLVACQQANRDLDAVAASTQKSSFGSASGAGSSSSGSSCGTARLISTSIAEAGWEPSITRPAGAATTTTTSRSAVKLCELPGGESAPKRTTALASDGSSPRA